MSRLKKARGRPKGSGLDDSVHLDAIATLIADNPDLKPTTAIKKLGITDPSAVRRLRDKYRAKGGPARPPRGVQAPVQSALRSTPPKASRVARDGAAPGLTASSRQMQRRRETSRGETLRGASAGVGGLAETRETPPQEWLAVWGGLGVQALAASVDFQLSMAGHAMRWPAISAALRQQIFLSDLAMSFYAPPSSQSETIH